MEPPDIDRTLRLEGDDLVIDVRTERADQEVTGGDTVILAMPAQYLIDVGEETPALAVQPLIGLLRDVAYESAANLNEQLHSGTFWVTTDPLVVWEKGLMHDCERCRAGVSRALDALAAEPEREIIIGQLFWAAP